MSAQTPETVYEIRHWSPDRWHCWLCLLQIYRLCDRHMPHHKQSLVQHDLRHVDGDHDQQQHRLIQYRFKQ